MAAQTVKVPHLGGITVGYRASQIDPSKPTTVLVHSFMTSHKLYDAQFDSTNVTAVTNLVAVDLLGHGSTRVDSGVEQFTYWDSAQMILQLLDHLKVDKFFALGTSQGGWIIVRMALLAPSRVSDIHERLFHVYRFRLMDVQVNILRRFKDSCLSVHLWTMNLSGHVILAAGILLL